MAEGPGKYDTVCTNVRLVTRARGVVLLVFDGDYGSGFSAQLPAEPDALRKMVRALRETLEQMERDLGA
jgi:hypothetical protein